MVPIMVVPPQWRQRRDPEGLAYDYSTHARKGEQPRAQWPRPALHPVPPPAELAARRHMVRPLQDPQEVHAVMWSLAAAPACWLLRYDQRLDCPSGAIRWLRPQIPERLLRWCDKATKRRLVMAFLEARRTRLTILGRLRDPRLFEGHGREPWQQQAQTAQGGHSRTQWDQPEHA